MYNFKTTWLLSIFVFFNSASANAFSDHFGATVGVHYHLGTIQNKDMSLQSRNIAAFSGDGLVGLNFKKFLIGLDMSYWSVGQLTSLSSAGGTNLRGTQYLLGLGLKYRMSPQWALQGAIDLFGNYDLKRNTFTDEDDNLKKPLAARLKLQWFFKDNLPLSADLGLSYTRYSTFVVTSTNYSVNTQILLASVGLTWHFGKPPGSKVEASPEAVAQPEAMREPKSIVRQEEPTPATIRFESNKFSLNEDALMEIKKVSDVATKDLTLKVLVVGHTDSSGDQLKNEKLSQARANAVRDNLLQSGLAKNQITVKSRGSLEPIATNESSEGRAQNRRVEVRIETLKEPVK